LCADQTPSEAFRSEPPSTRRALGHRPPLVLWLSFPLAGVLLYLTLRGLDWAAFWLALKNGHYAFLFLTIPIASLSYFIRALRWSVLVRSEGDVPVLSVFWANMVGYMGNAYLPARAGELMRSAFLGQKKGLGTTFVLATALSERILDAVTLVLIGSASLLSQGQLPPALTGAVRLMAVAACIGLTIIIAAPFQERLILRAFGRLPLPTVVSQRIAPQIGRFLVGMRSLQNVRRMLAFVLLSGVIWLMDAIGASVAARIIAQSLAMGQALILLAAMGLSSAIPSTPGYVGVYQFVAVTVLVPFGFSRTDALAYILILQVMNYAVVTFWGLLGLWGLNRSQGLAAPSSGQ
jgi:glycosyltransferase 2 family protein